MKEIIKRLKQIVGLEGKDFSYSESIQKLKSDPERIEANGYPGIFYKYFSLAPVPSKNFVQEFPLGSQLLPHFGKVKTVAEWKAIGIDLANQQQVTLKRKRKKVTLRFNPVPDPVVEKLRIKDTVNLRKELARIKEPVLA